MSDKDTKENYVIDKTVSCVTCKTPDGVWIYCPILDHMLTLDYFDETGELNGCNMHSDIKQEIK